MRIHKHTSKLSGGALFHALAVSTIIGMIVSGVILSEYYHRHLLHQNLVKEEVIRNAESGIVYFCSNQDTEEIESSDIDLFGRGKDSVRLERRTWGAYDVCVSTAHTGDQSSVCMAMIGIIPDPQNKFALWLADMDRALSVTGATRLNGKCYLPKAGVERAYIEGKSYSGRDLVYGSIAESSRFIPSVNNQRMESLESLFVAQPEDSVVLWEDILGLDSIMHSFSKNQLTIISNGIIRVSDVYMSGQIVLRSSSAIVVEKTSFLDDVILVAPRIEIQNEVEGKFQAYAYDSLIVGNDVTLEYPTVLGIVPNEKAIDNPALVVKGGSKVSGELLLAVETSGINHQGSVVIEKESTIEGKIHCCGNLDLKGTVNGSVSCQKFLLKTNSAVYENHLMDAIIDVDQRSHFWLASLLFNNQEGRNVIQWLN